MHKIIVIAEIGINHNGNMELAEDMIKEAKWAGADIAKFQLYSPIALFPDREVMVNGKNYFKEVMATELSKDQVMKLANVCSRVGIEFMASAFDLERLGWLEELGVKRHKIATRMRKNHEYCRAVASAGRHILYSHNQGESAHSFEGNIIDYLMCVPHYPTELTELHLRKFMFGEHFTGFSDHTIGIEASVCAMSRGARIIEKHFTLNRSIPGPDQAVSATPIELCQIVTYARAIEKILK